MMVDQRCLADEEDITKSSGLYVRRTVSWLTKIN